jgi:hypothetical protein
VSRALDRRSAALALVAAAFVLACKDELAPRCDVARCDGACVDLRVDPAHCGACGHACAEGELCSAGACALECAAPLVACAEENGARCASLAADPRHCGACGGPCPAGTVCSAATCLPSCLAPETACSSGAGAWCADLSTDALDCGACGNACAPGSACVDGTCRATCEGAGGTSCAGACVDVASDRLHCGACDVACEAGATCAGGACVDACRVAGAERCGDACAELETDPAHCGACGRACGSGAICVAGECAAPLCAAPGLPGDPDLLDTQGGSLTLVDVDADGLRDLVTFDAAGARLEIRRALASGGVGPPDAYAVGEGFHVAGAGDLDSDGDVDLVLAHYEGGLFVKWLNDGAARFSEGERIVRHEATQALVVDVDGDGRNDLVTRSPFVVDVRRAASGTSQTFFLNGIASLHAVDLDGDARPELIAGAYAGLLPVAVFPNEGDGTFGDPVGGDPAGAYVDDLEAGDVDGDGDVDLVFFGRQHSPPYEQFLAVTRNDDGGSFGAAETYALPLTNDRYDLLLEDVDADGAPDVVIGEVERLRVFLNPGDGRFAAPVISPAAVPQVLGATDFDRDGRLDVLAGNRVASGVEIRRGLGGGAFAGPEVDAGVVGHVAVADFDGDGRDDVASLALGDGQTVSGVLQVRRSVPDGLSLVYELAPFGATQLRAGDLDHDGRSDLMLVRAYGTAGVLRATGGGAFDAELPIVGVTGEVALGDATGDGVLDLLYTGHANYTDDARVAAGRGNGTFVVPAVGTSLAGLYPDAVGWGDVNGDRRADLVLVEVLGGDVSVITMSSRGDGTFGPPATVRFSSGFTYPDALLAVEDLDGDGAAEVAVHLRAYSAATYVGKVAILRGGQDALGPPEFHASAAPTNLIAVGALSGSGRRDLLVLTGFGNVVEVISPRGDATFRDEARWTVPVRGMSIAAGDLDGDARDEVVVTGASGAAIFRGACRGSAE